MKYIEKMFSDNNIDAKFSELKSDVSNYVVLDIEYRFGDEINGFLYKRSLGLTDCVLHEEEVRKILKGDINEIKSRLRDQKLKELGISK